VRFSQRGWPELIALELILVGVVGADGSARSSASEAKGTADADSAGRVMVPRGRGYSV
jgi:hypothetical protein